MASFLDDMSLNKRQTEDEGERMMRMKVLCYYVLGGELVSVRSWELYTAVSLGGH